MEGDPINNIIKSALELNNVMELNWKYITRYKSYLNNNMELVNKFCKFVDILKCIIDILKRIIYEPFGKMLTREY